jgi:hypothetical protein
VLETGWNCSSACLSGRQISFLDINVCVCARAACVRACARVCDCLMTLLLFFFFLVFFDKENMVQHPCRVSAFSYAFALKAVGMSCHDI